MGDLSQKRNNILLSETSGYRLVVKMIRLKCCSINLFIMYKHEWSCYDFTKNKSKFFNAWYSSSVQRILKESVQNLVPTWKTSTPLWELSERKFWSDEDPPKIGSLESLIWLRNDDSTTYMHPPLEEAAEIMFPGQDVRVTFTLQQEPIIYLPKRRMVFDLRDHVFGGGFESYHEYRARNHDECLLNYSPLMIFNKR